MKYYIKGCTDENKEPLVKIQTYRNSIFSALALVFDLFKNGYTKLEIIKKD